MDPVLPRLGGHRVAVYLVYVMFTSRTSFRQVHRVEHGVSRTNRKTSQEYDANPMPCRMRGTKQVPWTGYGHLNDVLSRYKCLPVVPPQRNTSLRLERLIVTHCETATTLMYTIERT